MSNLILSTKLYIPPLRPNLVPRPRLTERLAAGVAYPLTLIAAPAGFGKSTLVSEWLQRKDELGMMNDESSIHHSSFIVHHLRVAWLSLDKDDNDPIRFLTYFITALETVSPGLNADALALLQSPQPPPLPVVLPLVINNLNSLTHQLILALDDYHVITTPAIHEALTFLLDHLPPQLRLILTSRTNPPLPLARLRVRNQLHELRAHDLRFSEAEAADFLQQVMGLSLSVEAVAALEQRTEGWIAGLQLAALSMQGRGDFEDFIQSFTGSHTYIVDYLAEEVLNRQPDHVQTFLLKTSILDRMCGPLCDAILSRGAALRQAQEEPQAAEQGGRGDEKASSPTSLPHLTPASSQEILEQLDRANLFLIPLDNERRWYRYHHLFADVLRNRLRQASSTSEEDLAGTAGLHRRASAWFEGAGLIDEAIRHALAAPDVGLAASLVERHSLAALQQSQILLIRTWLEQLPGGLVQTRPRLILARGWTLLLTGHQQAIEQWLATPPVTAALQASDLPTGVVGELALLRARMALMQRDNTRGLELAQQALGYLLDDDQGLQVAAAYMIGVAQLQGGEITAASRIFAEAATLAETKGEAYTALLALQDLGELQSRQGQLSQAIQTCQRAIRLVTRWGGQPMPAAGLAHISLGELLYERNNLDGAAQALAYGIDLLRGSIEQYVLAHGYVTLARVQLARGQGEGAFVTLQRGEAWFTQMQVTALGAETLLALGKARLWLEQGQVAAVVHWAQNCKWQPEETNLGYLQRLLLVRLRLAQSRDDPQGPLLLEAAETLSHLLALAETGGWLSQVIEILALQALVCQGQGDSPGALVTLERALTLAEPEGYIRLFVDEDEPMRVLILDFRAQLEQQASHLQPYLDSLLAAFPDPRLKPITIQNPATGTHPVGYSEASQAKSKIQNLIEPLSERELEVLALIAAGLSNQEIAQKLVVALSTVKKHINNIYTKLGVNSRTQALVQARELKLL